MIRKTPIAIGTALAAAFAAGPGTAQQAAPLQVPAKSVPVPSDVAAKHAAQYIKAHRSQESVQRQFGAVVSNPKAKVVYNKAYAPPAPPAAGKAAPPATPAPKAG